MQTLDFIFDRWNLDKSKKYIHMQGYSREGTLTRLFKRLNFKLGCEIGVERARFSKILCQANPDLKLYGVDPWLFSEGYRDHVSQERLDGFSQETRQRMMQFNFQIIRDYSLNAAKRFNDNVLDFVYIDAMHDYKSVKEDIAAWHSKVRKGGIVSGHDYIDGADNDRPDKPDYGVKKAVNEWVEEKNIKHLFILEKDHVPSWFYVKGKNEAPTPLHPGYLLPTLRRERNPSEAPQSGAQGDEATKGIIYYTDNRLDEKIMKRCQQQLMKVESPKLPIVSVSLKPIAFGCNYTLEAKRGYLTLTKQIIKALEESTADVVFFCEHDVLYHPSHFDFTPTSKDVFYYNMNSWMLRVNDGHLLYYDHRSLSGMCCFRETALAHFKKRKERIEALLKEAGNTGMVKATSGNTISLKEAIHRLGFEPGTHSRPERIDNLGAANFMSEFPNVDIKHSNNLTQNRWRIDQFRDKSVAKTWQEAEDYQIEGLGRIKI